MSELRELYQQVIIDHGRRPRNFFALESANHIKEGWNPLCGDKITLYLYEANGIIQSAAFQGGGCAISMASASLMTEAVKGKSSAQIIQLFDDFHLLVTQNDLCNDEERLGKLMIFRGVAEFPGRVKCATLAWHTLRAALIHENKTVCTEN
jgi:nitrogen fixation NifU-like protein